VTTSTEGTRADRVSDRADVANDEAERRWHDHRLAAAGLHLAVLLLPFLAALGATGVASAFVPSPTGGSARLGWWVGLLVVSLLAAWVTSRLAARLLPLAVLLRLSLLFPNQAPSRYAVARTAGNPTALRRAAEAGQGDVGSAALHALALLATLAKHDKGTRGHSERVRVFTDLVAAEMRLPSGDRDLLRWASLLHDVGKLEVSGDLLRKTGRPDAAEWAEIQGHPAAGEHRLGALATWLGPWIGGVTEHHERYDGAGYPHHLGGEAISLAGRIVAVTDAYETMTAARSYKKPMTAVAARAELTRCAGSQFDPRVVRAFLAVSLPRPIWQLGPLAALTRLPLAFSPAPGFAPAALQAALVGGAGVAAVVAPRVLPVPAPRPAVLAAAAAESRTPGTPVATPSSGGMTNGHRRSTTVPGSAASRVPVLRKPAPVLPTMLPNATEVSVPAALGVVPAQASASPEAGSVPTDGGQPGQPEPAPTTEVTPAPTTAPTASPAPAGSTAGRPAAATSQPGPAETGHRSPASGKPRPSATPASRSSAAPAAGNSSAGGTQPKPEHRSPVVDAGPGPATPQPPVTTPSASPAGSDDGTGQKDPGAAASGSPGAPVTGATPVVVPAPDVAVPVVAEPVVVEPVVVEPVVVEPVVVEPVEVKPVVVVPVVPAPGLG